MKKDSTFQSSTRMSVQRRDLLAAGAKLGLAALCLTAAGAFFKNIRYLIPGAAAEKRNSFNAGDARDFSLGAVDGRWKDSHGVWLVRTFEGLYGVSAVTEKAAAVEWDSKNQVFRDVLLGTLFYKSGVYFSGPKQKSLTRTAIRISPEGFVFVDPSKKFRQDRGEWVRPGSFLPLVKTI